ncbi:MAG: response regulator [Polyangia bacterium]
MPDSQNVSPLVARRQLGFLETFDKKLEGFRREMERLERAAGSGKSYGGSWPTEGLERIARSLVGAGAVYGLPAVTDWARSFLERLDSLRSGEQAPSRDDFAWLAEQIGALSSLRDEARDRAESVADPEAAERRRAEERQRSQERRTSSQPPPFIAPSTTTDPPPPSEGESAPRTSSSIPPRPSAPPEPAAAPTTATELEEQPEIRPIVHVVAATAGLRGQIVTTLREAGFEPLEIPSPEAFDRAVEETPDLIALDADDPEPGGNALADALARDPLTDFVPVLRVTGASDAPAGRAIPKPVDGERLVAEARRLAGPNARTARLVLGLRDPSLDELVRFVFDEIRRGVLDSATGGSEKERFRVAGEGRLMAGVWGLVAQLRRAAARGSSGRIRFSPFGEGLLGVMSLAEGEEVLAPAACPEPDEEDLAALSGLRVVVADDDAQIRVAFDQVLSEAGLRVRTAADGLEALRMIREDPPDLIVSDIVMPGLDGWELCNRIRNDYALRHVPLIVLSWKEDFLERLGGSGVAADDLVIEEVDRRQILGHAARVLRPRILLERRLALAGDVSGRVENVGIRTLLDAALAGRPSCRITLRESWRHFEVEIRDGELVAVTAGWRDGSFVTGRAALERLLGAGSGRFTVVDATDTPQPQFETGDEAIVKHACEHLDRLVMQIADGALLDIERVELDDETLERYAEIAPPKLHPALDRLRAGDTPREIILSRTASPDALETLLLDLVRIGAVGGIQGPEPDPDRKPISRDSERWLALGRGVRLDEDEEEREPPRRRASSPVPPRRSTPTPPVARASAAADERLVSRGWQVLTLIAAIALGFSLWLNYRLWPHESDSGESAAAEREPRESASEPRPDIRRLLEEQEREQRTALAAEEEEPRPEEEIAEPAEESPAAIEQAEETGQVEEDPAQQKSAKRDGYRRGDRSRRTGATGGEDRERRKKGRAAKAASGGAEPAEKNPYASEEKKKEPAKQAGVLVIGAPPGAEGPIRVAVDGRPRGRAPLTLELSAGLHEVTFSAGGKRTLRMVSIKPGKTKNVTAKVSP